jgi:hypothetical protein
MQEDYQDREAEYAFLFITLRRASNLLKDGCDWK